MNDISRVSDIITSPDSLQDQVENAFPDTETSFPPSPLFDLPQLEVRWDEPLNTLWAFYTPADKPNYSFSMLQDTLTWQNESRRLFGANPALKYMVLGSRFPGVFNLGGDLEMFVQCIEQQNREQLLKYSYLCIETVAKSWRSNDMNIINIGLAQGDALGGGFEALMTFDVIVAERHAKFGLPEILFGLFPGMGAFSILSRRLGDSCARRMILEGKVHSAEEMHEMGLVDVVAETGAGEQAVRDYIKANRSRHSGHVGIYNAGRRVNPLEFDELKDIVERWVDTALKLTVQDRKLMRRLAGAQARLHAQP